MPKAYIHPRHPGLLSFYAKSRMRRLFIPARHYAPGKDHTYEFSAGLGLMYVYVRLGHVRDGGSFFEVKWEGGVRHLLWDVSY